MVNIRYKFIFSLNCLPFKISEIVQQPNLERRLGPMVLAAKGICTMLGASVYIIPFMIQRNVAGIGPFVIPAFIFAAIPALFGTTAYASLATAMPVMGVIVGAVWVMVERPNGLTIDPIS